MVAESAGATPTLTHEKINEFMPKVEAAPQMQTLNLPKLKKKTVKTELPKLKLPKLKKIEA